MYYSLKLLTALSASALLHFNTSAQILDPVKWTFTKTKINAVTYELHLNAAIDDGWHIYSQVQPKNAIAMPLEVNFLNNSLLVFEGRPKEAGKLSKVFDRSINVGAYQYADKLAIIQVVKLKKPAKTVVKGSVTFQVCNNQRCLPPEEEEFEIVLN